MKSWLWRGTLAAAIALPALSGVARAQSSKDGFDSRQRLTGCDGSGIFGEKDVFLGNRRVPGSKYNLG